MMKYLLLALVLHFNAIADENVNGAVPTADQQQDSAMADDNNQKEEFATLEELLKLRDPFKRVIQVSDPSIDLADLPELERTPVEDLKLIGVITGPKKLKALLKTPSGSTLFVSINQSVGTRKGKVSRITSNFVEVQERVKNLLGREDIVIAKIPLEGDTKN